MNGIHSSATPLSERKFDRLLAVVFGFFAFTSLATDVFATFGIDVATSSNPLAQAMYSYATMADPLLLSDNPAIHILSSISFFVFGPFSVVLVWALIKGWRPIRIPAIIYASAMTYSMPVYFYIEFTSTTPPTHLPVFFLATVPYVVFPIVLIGHMWRSPYWSQPSP